MARVDHWKAASAAYAIDRATFVHGGKHAEAVLSYRDAEAKRKTTAVAVYDCASRTCIAHRATSGDEVLRGASPSRKAVAVVRKAADGTHTVELWRGARRVACCRAGAKVHGHVATPGQTFGRLSWSPDETRVVYAAERVADDEPRGFFDADGGGTAGTKFHARESWGEQLTELSDPGLVVADFADSSVRMLDLHADGVDGGFGQAVWTPDGRGLVCVGWKLVHGRRLGLQYCNNRPSVLVHLADVAETERAATVLSSDVPHAYAPKFSPDGATLAYLTTNDRVYKSTHGMSSVLVARPWPVSDAPVQTVVGVVAEALDSGFTGLYNPTWAWASPSRIVFSSPMRSTVVLWAVDVASGAMERLSPDEKTADWALADVDCESGAVLAVTSSPSQPPQLAMRGGASGDVFALVTPADEQPSLGDSMTHEILRVGPGFDVIILRPAPSGAPAPVVLYPHGGPHSAFSCAFSAANACFLLHGYALILVNYAGSLGFGQDALESLAGRVGTQDVGHCERALEAALGAHGDVLDAGRVFCFGGSHGGFLATHLACTNAVTAVACRNPVTNLTSLICTSDIPDWCNVEAGLAPDTRASRAQFDVLWAASPMSRVEQCRTPVLFLCGALDLRVPMSQAREFFYALRRQGVATRLVTYPEDCHPLSSVETEADSTPSPSPCAVVFSATDVRVVCLFPCAQVS